MKRKGGDSRKINEEDQPWHCCIHSQTGKSLIQEKEILTFLLAAIGGFCDTITFLKGNHTFSGHVTGNIVVFFASYFGSPESAKNDIDYIHLLIIPQFAICVALAGRIVYRSGPEVLLLLMGLILCIAGLIPCFITDISPYVPSLIAVVAMAFQNAFNDLHQSAVHMKTTIVTGTLTRISLVLSNMLCFGSCMNSIFGEPMHIQKGKRMKFEDIDELDQCEVYIANAFLLNDEYFEPNPILIKEDSFRDKILHQTAKKKFPSISTIEKDVLARPSMKGRETISRQSLFRPSVSVKKRQTNLINLPVAATYHFEDLCGPSLGMFGFVGGCAVGSAFGVYFDLRGLLLPGVVLLLTWLYVHYHCQCVCVQDKLIQEDGVSPYNKQMDSDEYDKRFSEAPTGISLKDTQKEDQIIDGTIHEGDEDG